MVPRSCAICGNAGRYMSIENGLTVLSAPRMRMMRRSPRRVRVMMILFLGFQFVGRRAGVSRRSRSQCISEGASAIAALTSFTPSSLDHSAGPAMLPISQPERSTSTRRRHAESFAGGFQVLEHVGARVGIIGEVADADLFEKGQRLLRIAGVDVDGDDFEVRAAEFALQRVERRHFLAAWHAPGRPQVEQHGAAAPIGKLAVAAWRRP